MRSFVNQDLVRLVPISIEYYTLSSSACIAYSLDVLASVQGIQIFTVFGLMELSVTLEIIRV